MHLRTLLTHTREREEGIGHVCEGTDPYPTRRTTVVLHLRDVSGVRGLVLVERPF